jgi:signal transduction histidine kinase
MRRQPARAAQDQLEYALTSVASLAGSARQVSAELGSVLVDTLGLEAAIAWHLHQFQKYTGMTCEFTVSNATDADLPENYAGTIFEIYNEAMSKAARHAGAGRVAIALTIVPHEVTMAVRNDGIGLTVSLPIA